MATSKLQREASQLLSTHLGHYTIRENKRPDWLAMKTGERLELDFYIEEPKIAIEVQGQQHYTYTPHFHKTYAAFEAQLFRDREKKRLCKSKGVTLYEVISLDEVLEIAVKLCPEIPYPVHSNAIQQEKQLQARAQKKKRREEIRHLFLDHKRTVRQHLRKLLNEFFEFEDAKILTPGIQRRIQRSLIALQQHQEVKGDVQFSSYECDLLKIAQGLIAEIAR